MGIDARTPIPTTKGWLPLSELQAGDEVFSYTGEPTKVTLVQKYTPRTCFKVWMKDGLSITMDERSGIPAYAYRTYSRLKAWSESRQRIRKATIYPANPRDIMEKRAGRCRIPVCQPLRPAPFHLPIEPHRFGQWIMEPRKKRRYDQTEITRELLDRYPVVPDHIPEDYLFASFEQRLALLRGILSTRPKCFKTKLTKFSIDIQDLRLARQVQCLVESLGMRSSVAASGTYWRLSFRSFLRLVEEQTPPAKPLDLEFRRIRRVSEVEPRECVYFKTESETNAVLVSEGFITLVP